MNVAVLSTNSKDAGKIPTKEVIQAEFKRIGKDAKSEHVLVVFMAGHGVVYAGEYYYRGTRRRPR